jgi:hypothetical protein
LDTACFGWGYATALIFKHHRMPFLITIMISALGFFGSNDHRIFCVRLSGDISH